MINLIAKYVPITRGKIAIARWLSLLVRLFLKDKQIVTRNGIHFELDLKEGIDFHVFLFGNFQRHVIKNKLIKIPEDSVIFDVGANIGIMSLFFAQQAKRGQIHAFEPTKFALTKFRRNLELNEELSKRIIVNNCFVSSKSSEKSQLTAYSSWPLVGHQEKHPVHLGVAKESGGVPAITLDEYANLNDIQNIFLIKIDTDGHEFEVLNGMKEVLEKIRPNVIFEIGIYVMLEKNLSFSDYENLFNKYKYSLHTTNGVGITPDNFEKYIPQLGTIDILAIPEKNE